MRDEVFLRGDVPMTKSEVRAVSISKLELSESSVLYDVGAGTGSVSIESGQVIKSGRIFAIEKNPEAIRLLKANREKFQTENMEIIEGTAPKAMEGLAAPTHAFLGGTSGNVDEILDVLLEKNPSVRIVINVIAVESLCLAVESLKRRGIEPEIVSVQVAKARKAGAYHLMQGQNPVYILSFGGNEN
ncbi:precorrin-6Y C5,15-methyltransferase (decarboxylating) subunit CbiT [Clostridium sp. AM58-1XD]|uniref:precorrin-6Y C5,15-methyltransferase (decarboxylating) subunit CbiT n=1 Tax=Clostridium sp. AM58-1XD TaxID=2292307 RepID=UPI001FA91D13|nr:precorrin-6Y C5,15-methyltransferase (decarboxylating) subunit CbiT [Clostridium sp. AM58-1XD]